MCYINFLALKYFLGKENVLKPRLNRKRAVPSQKIPNTRSPDEKKIKLSTDREERALRRELFPIHNPAIQCYNEISESEGTSIICETSKGTESTDVIFTSDSDPHSTSSNNNSMEINESSCARCQCMCMCISHQNTVIQNKITVLDFIEKDAQIIAFTGIENATAYNRICAIVEIIEAELAPDRSWLMNVKLRVLLTFMKLKIDCSFTVLAAFFKCSIAQCCTIFHFMTRVMAKFFKHLITWPIRKEVDQNMPQCFSNYRQTRVIIDCTEFPVQACQDLKCRVRCYSFYKSNHTLKVLIGISPGGLITYRSEAYGGRASDTFIFKESKISDLCDKGDGVMADKGFLISEELEKKNLILIQPPFLKSKNQTKPQLSKTDAFINKDVASARVHVERAIQRCKTFGILSHKVPWHIVPYFDDVLTIILGLVNLSHPILDNKRF